jgi:hypothetical protein
MAAKLENSGGLNKQRKRGAGEPEEIIFGYSTASHPDNYLFFQCKPRKQIYFGLTLKTEIWGRCCLTKFLFIGYAFDK